MADGPDSQADDTASLPDAPGRGPDREAIARRRGLDKILGVIQALLGEGGCPWDKEQTPQSLADYVIEEGFELVEAIRADAPLDQGPQAGSGQDVTRETVEVPKETVEVMEELGDVLFLLAFVATLYERGGRFTLDDVTEANAAKMIRRHPHVFGDLQVDTKGQLLANWERIKRAEKTDGRELPKGVFESLPKGLPPMLKAYRIHSKAARAGFTWETDADAEAQFRSEWDEWEAARASGDPERMEQEFGDVLFTLVELGRRQGIKANAALDGTNLRFLERFQAMEAMARDTGRDLAELDLAEMNVLWERAKAS